jgi:iron complex transport system substrate-binding protein
MRIASLLPAATEWICALGAADALVARSHECSFPACVANVPAVTQATYDDSGSSASIDEAVRTTLQQGLSLYTVDLDRLQALQPDLIVTQDQCDVCAVSRSALDEALASWTHAAPDVFSMQPSTLKGVLDTGLRLGKRLGRLRDAMRVIADGEKRLRALHQRLGYNRRAAEPEALPSVACIEWMDPLMVAGHWMPDVVEMAGGRAMLADAGAPSETIGLDALREADPDAIAVLPCGFSIEQTRRDLPALTGRPGWTSLRAVREGRVALFDGSAYFNRPGPRLYRSVELMAAALHDVALDAPPEAWEYQPYDFAEASA